MSVSSITIKIDSLIRVGRGGGGEERLKREGESPEKEGQAYKREGNHLRGRV